MTTKFPLSAVLMELAAGIPCISGGKGLSLLWVPRLQNEEADALSNEHFAGFDPAKRVTVDPSDLPWKVLPKMVAYGSDLLARCEHIKAEALVDGNATEVAKKKRKAGGRLRDLDPW